jgi:glutathione peroxidase
MQAIHFIRGFLALAIGVAVAPAAWAQAAPAAAAPAACPALLQHTMTRLQDDAPQPLCQFAGKVLLVVNTASHCGYTPQYEGLEALHKRYAAQGLVVLGFPSNDFGAQEPGDAKAIAETCFNVYGVRFPMFNKITVVGPNVHPLYAALVRAGAQAPKWNFHKVLVDRQGRVVTSFASDVAPQDRRVAAAVEKQLAAR